MIEKNLNKFLMIVFVLIINHTIKIKIMKIKTLLYVYEYILNLIDIFLLKKLYLHRDICEIVERLVCEICETSTDFRAFYVSDNP